MSTGGAFSGTTSGTTRDSQGGVFNNVNSSVSADAGSGTGSTAEFLALLAAEAATRLANDNTEIGLREMADSTEMTERVAGDASLEASKQDTLTAGTNITIVNDVISSVGGGGSAPIITTYTLRLDFLPGVDAPTVVVNTGTEIPTVDFIANSISDSEIPETSDVNVNGIPFILNTDYMISEGVLQFQGYDLVPQDGDVIVISATLIS